MKHVVCHSRQRGNSFFTMVLFIMMLVSTALMYYYYQRTQMLQRELYTLKSGEATVITTDGIGELAGQSSPARPAPAAAPTTGMAAADNPPVANSAPGAAAPAGQPAPPSATEFNANSPESANTAAASQNARGDVPTLNAENTDNPTAESATESNSVQDSGSSGIESPADTARPSDDNAATPASGEQSLYNMQQPTVKVKAPKRR